MKKIGFIGLGNMGLPMATNLTKAGVKLKVFDLQPAPLAIMKDNGAEISASAKDVCVDVDFVVSMLPAGKHVRDLYLGTNNDGLLSHANKGVLFIDCSTIDSKTAIDVHSSAKELEIGFIDAPVSGGVAAATAGTLTFMCGGANDHFERSKAALELMGANIFHAGSDGAGQVAKMCNNMLLAIHMIGTSEALKLGENNGLDASKLTEIMMASSGANWSLEKYNPFPGVNGAVPSSNDYKPGFMVDLMTKDLNLALDNAKSTNSKTPLGQQALQLYTQKQAAGDGKLDFSSIIQLFD